MANAHRQSARAAVDARVDKLLAQMTLAEKIDLLGGTDGFYLRGVPRLNVPRMKMADGPFGVRNNGPSTAVAGGIALAAAWNPALAERVGSELGRDARARGVHFLLAPGVNLYVAPMNGRNFEYFGEDPLLAGQLAAAFVTGVQAQGVSATVKHFLGNNSEFDRHNTDVVVDERALREIYLPAFEAAVKDGNVAAIMTSYNLVNGHHMSQHAAINNGIVKKEWGFDGVIMSDWTSTYDALLAANGGLDIEMPSGAMMNRGTLLPAIEQGKVSQATIDDKVRRILRVAVRLGWLDHDQTDASVPQDNPQGRQVALQTAREGMVLLKNEGPLLPLERGRIRTVAVIGPNAHPAVPVAGGSAAVQPIYAISFRDGVGNVGGPSITVVHHRGIAPVAELAEQTHYSSDRAGSVPGLAFEGFSNIELSGTAAATRTVPHIALSGPFFKGSDRGRGSSARWSGYFTPRTAGPHRIAVETTRGDGGHRLYIDDQPVIDNWRLGKPLATHASVVLSAGPHRVRFEQFRRAEWGAPATRVAIVHDERVVESAAREMARTADVVVAAVGFDKESEGEASDRSFALPVGQDELIRALVDANPKTIVVITSGGGTDMTRWIDRVPALVQAWYPGQEGGNAFGELLFGDVNFSGRLPATFERRLEDNPSLASYYPAAGTTKVSYTNGVFVGYRAFQQHKIAPLFPFGYGLSYTKFTYSNLRVVPRAGEWAFDVVFDIKNDGSRAGADVPQIYVAEMKPSLPRPPMELKGFSKVFLGPGASKRVSIALDERAFAYFDAVAHQWRVKPGEFEILLGASSAETPLKTVVSLQSPER
jgi:beta-glucosidase